jgi:hypothetical protein
MPLYLSQPITYQARARYDHKPVYYAAGTQTQKRIQRLQRLP